MLLFRDPAPFASAGGSGGAGEMVRCFARRPRWLARAPATAPEAGAVPKTNGMDTV